MHQEHVAVAVARVLKRLSGAEFCVDVVDCSTMKRSSSARATLSGANESALSKSAPRTMTETRTKRLFIALSHASPGCVHGVRAQSVGSKSRGQSARGPEVSTRFASLLRLRHDCRR